MKKFLIFFILLVSIITFFLMNPLKPALSEEEYKEKKANEYREDIEEKYPELSKEEVDSKVEFYKEHLVKSNQPQKMEFRGGVKDRINHNRRNLYIIFNVLCSPRRIFWKMVIEQLFVYFMSVGTCFFDIKYVSINPVPIDNFNDKFCKKK